MILLESPGIEEVCFASSEEEWRRKLALFGITKIKVTQDKGIIYEYRIEIFVESPATFYFVDETGDYYKLWVKNRGSHHVDYNSDKPTIRTIRRTL